MTTRRNFLKTGSLSLAGLMMGAKLFAQTAECTVASVEK